MKNLLDAWPKISRQLAGKHLLLLLDYDGTLVPIRKTPEEAILPDCVEKLLRELSGNPNITLAFISGRDFDDLKSKVKLKNAIFASNHGFKITGKGLRFKARIPSTALKSLKDFHAQLLKVTQAMPGVFIERKKYSVAVHYRLAQSKNLRLTKKAFDALFSAYRHRGLALQCGKKVSEVLATVDWNKGKAALYILRETRSMAAPRQIVPIYIGDDKTDENAFQAISGIGFAIRVGRNKNSHANYFLDNTAKVCKFLGMVSTHN